MNLFILDEDIDLCAQYHCDKHVVKMVVEGAQLLCGAHHVAGTSPVPYRASHLHHPCAKWVRDSLENYRYALDLSLALAREYTCRYGKVHKTESVLHWCASNVPELDSKGLTPFVQAMPPQYQGPCAVQAYRSYYIGEKAGFSAWKGRSVPDWFRT
jgi:hypothetical protein